MMFKRLVENRPTSAPRPSSFGRALAVRALAMGIAVITVWQVAPRSAAAEEPLQYNRDIRPILAEHCFACHGPDSASREADLRLDQRSAAIEMNAIVPSKPDESEMLRRIHADDPDELMPPPASKKPLSDGDKQMLRQWIEQGAEYQLHWSLIPPRRPEPPVVKQVSWIRNPIDAFVLARLEVEGLTPSPAADRRALARRVSLDLTGLPPSVESVERFVADSSPEAYEKLVDQLLASRSWGEHRARYWLDAARYADTHGIHFDNFREMWSYRDWVIDAFNQNMPFDQFTIENLAGDLLPNRTLEQQIGSGFNRCNMTTNEGGIIDEEYLVLYTRDRTETTSLVWMGLTAGCAVCHNHKFDPLSQREFYELAAFFNNTTQGARDGNIKDTPPILPVPLEVDRPRWDALPELIAEAKQQVQRRREQARPQFDAWLAEAGPESLGPSVAEDALHVQAKFDEGRGETVTLLVDDQSLQVDLKKTAQWEAHGPSQSALSVQGAALELPDAGALSASSRSPAPLGSSCRSTMAMAPSVREWTMRTTIAAGIFGVSDVKSACTSSTNGPLAA